MSDPVFKLQLLARAELALTEIYARRAATRTGYLAFALVLALLGLGMLNLAGYLALSTSVSPAMAALIMAIANGVIAALVISASRKAGPSEGEERMARELRELAYREVSEDVDEVKARLEHLTGEVTAIGESVNRGASTLKFLIGLLKKG
ncbi:hypothetical protein EY643_11940 [Halioglobus maricola]|uniref:Phage holin family protein n=1 Tax=Halioglobus maricola TaxID=2601894 RepID=A0A5P9NM26_9GAMM|nr:hypothetical protein [Halioglobus maricola]QFU76314.1 hypothetical protein EY643_11940 [Halioglobus maricola]